MKNLLDILYPMVILIMMTPERLKQWRKDNRYTQDALAKVLGVGQVCVARWETGVRKIPTFLHLALRCLELEGGEPLKGIHANANEKEV
jgi:DNA-binding transcriptional regulator YiaG